MYYNPANKSFGLSSAATAGKDVKPSANRLEKLRVLVIDDDEFMLDIVSMSLARLDINAVTACSEGRDALSKIDAGERFDVIMVDLRMPAMDGVEVLRNLAVRGFPGGILVLSGEDARLLKTAQSLASAHRLNVIGCLPKPVTADALQQVLNSFDPIPAPAMPATVSPVGPDEIRGAIESGQIVPWFQPKIRVEDRSLASVEILARWRHLERGQVPPIGFIPVAEEHGLIDDLTWSLFEQALAWIGRWRRQGIEFVAGMNLSVHSLELVDLPERLAALAAASKVPCESIMLELTESKLILNLETALDVLIRLRLRGFGLGIDDFGTGYSSMSQIKNIPFTELKIDRAFVHGAAEDPAGCAILELSAALGRNLEMTIVAEGVEDQSDWDQMAAAGCDLAQGFFIASPMPGDEFERWMQEWNASIR